MNELWVEQTRQGIALQLRIWCEDTGHIHTVWKLCNLNNSEIGFTGGRFRRHRPNIRKNCVTLPLARRRLTIFSEVLEWIAENVEGGWSMDFTTGDPVSPGGGLPSMCVQADLNLYFEHDEDAVLCLLKFR